MTDFLDGVRFYEEDGKRRLERDIPICDFCCGPANDYPIKWSYPTGLVKVDLDGIITHSDDDWGACDECHRLIEELDIEEYHPDFAPLVARCLRIQFATFGQGIKQFDEMPLAEKVVLIGKLEHHLFRWWKARLGPPLAEGEFDPKSGERLENDETDPI